MTDLSESGRDAAARLWRDGLDAVIDDPLEPSFARAAIAEFGRLQKESTPGIYREALRGAEISAEQLNVEPFHGVLEVLQNADDVHATELRIATRTRSGGMDLLFVHDGEQVRLPHLIAMALAFLSTKRDDPTAKGRFGIGLKTLGRLGDVLTVHCGPYHASIVAGQISVAPPARLIRGFYEPDRGQTLLELRLRAGFDTRAFAEWIRSLQASSLLFLDSVRAIRVVNLRSQKTVHESRLEEEDAGSFELVVGRHSLVCTETGLKDRANDLSWRRFTIERPVPPGAPKRQHKATGKATPLGIAVPADAKAAKPAGLFAGLPVVPHIEMPVSVNAQFNVDTARAGVQHDSWNAWLLDRASELIVAVTRARFEAQPAAAWIAIPLLAEVQSLEDRWLREKFGQLTMSIHGQLARSARLPIDGKTSRIRDLVYEAEELEGIVTMDDLTRIFPKSAPLPATFRDGAGRWRKVLAEIGLSSRLTVKDAVGILKWDDQTMRERPVAWFINFASAVISAGEGNSLLWARSVVLVDGARVVPPHPEDEAEVLVRKMHAHSLGQQLKLARVIHPAYLSNNAQAVQVSEWLVAADLLLDDVGDEATLRALAKRGSDGQVEPLALSDLDLITLRDALANLESADPEKLGPDIGRAIAVHGFYWDRGRRVRTRVRPAASYMPARLEDRSDGWAKAAALTPGILWIESRYRSVLRRTDKDKHAPGANTLFRLLGAEIAPRLLEPESVESRHGEPASPINFDALTTSQRSALDGVHATHLQRDRLAPELDLVISDITKERSKRKRRERARALMRTLNREWGRLYEGRERALAVYSYHLWHQATTLPATWIAAAMDSAWMTTEAGTPTPPCHLIVRTKAMEALHGSRSPRYASEVDFSAASWPVTRALGLQTDPRISEVLEELIKLRLSRTAVDQARADVRYAAIASAITNVDAAPDSAIGDVTVRQLRARFSAKAGLIHVDGRWWRPSQVLRGKPVLGEHRAFVSDGPLADRLWRLLRIRQPTLSDCVSVLRTISRSAPYPNDEQTVVNTYLYMAEHLAIASRGEVRAMGSLPLWLGDRWLGGRPIYLVRNPEVARELSAKLPIWRPPVSPQILGELFGALKVTELSDEDFRPLVTASDCANGESEAETFFHAVEHLMDWLSRHDPALYRQLDVPWDELGRPLIALPRELRLQLRLSGRKPLQLLARGHIQREPLQFSFASREEIGEDGLGGRLVGSLFGRGDQDKVALAWAKAWSRASHGEATPGMRLAEDPASTLDMDELFQQAARLAPTSRKAVSGRDQTPTAKSDGARLAGQSVRRLKKPSDLVVEQVTRPTGQGNSSTASGRRGLRQDAPVGLPIDEGNRPVARSGPVAYSPQEKEHLALLALQLAINGEQSDLKDFRHLRGIGADALDELKRAFEIKSFAQAMPDQVSLTANEFDRARKDGTKYFLAVVSGLEEGWETIVRIIGDPLRNLDVLKSTSLVLGGIRTASEPIEVRLGIGLSASGP